MAWRYRDRATKRLVSNATYSRSRSQGGTRFERISDAKWNVRAERKPSQTRKSIGKSKADRPKASGKSKGIASGSKIPSNAREYEQMFEAKLQKLSKKKRHEFYQEEYDGPEYETGVDY